VNAAHGHTQHAAAEVMLDDITTVHSDDTSDDDAHDDEAEPAEEEDGEEEEEYGESCGPGSNDSDSGDKYSYRCA
jgi:hypothetical protein